MMSAPDNPRAKITTMSLELEQIKRIVEGALFAAGQPMKLDKIVALFPEEEAPATEILVEVLTQLRDDYRERGVMLKEVASGYRFQVQESVAPWVSRLWEEKPPRYSRALLETLALIGIMNIVQVITFTVIAF